VTRLFWTPLAQGDLRAIKDYMRDRDADAGVRIVAAIRDKARLLRAHPFAGEPSGIADTRKLTVERFGYVVIYRIRGDAAEILRIHHAAQDWRPA